MRTLLLLLSLGCSVVLTAFAAPAGALVAPARTIVGPHPDVLELGGVAMAEDGSGGLVYRQRVGGRAHVFVARLAGGHWQPPQRVDVGQGFDSSWPRIGAGNGGRLVVTWVQEFGANTDRLFSAALDPGATRFQSPTPVDLNVGEALATYPSLDMNRGGSAYIAYRVPTDASVAGLPPGYVRSETRIARYNGSFWSVLGSVANRNPASPVAQPTALNSPKVQTDVFGNGLVAFQEPDDDFFDRIWARRIFGPTLGIPLLVSPQQWGGTALRAGADALSLDGTDYGAAAVAFRQLAGERTGLDRTRTMVNTIPEVFDPAAAAFKGPLVADTGAPGGPGPPAVAMASSGMFLAGFGASGASFAATGVTGRDSLDRLDQGGSAVGGDPVVELADSEASVAAWKLQLGNRAGVGIRERRTARDVRRRTVSAAAGGPVNDLALAGSGFGDGIVAFQQGGQGAGQIAAALVDSPPQRFAVQTPVRWVRSRRVRLAWDPAPHAANLSGVRYSVVLGDEEVASRLRRRSYVLRTRRHGDGRHDVRVVATDSAGQETDSRLAELKLDRRPPTARVNPARRAVRVRVSDGRRRASGARKAGTVISFGDGKRARGKLRVRHRYKRAGRFRLVIRVRDRAGNRRVIKRTVRVRR